MVVITENIMNGKRFPGKDKEFRFGHISFKLKDINWQKDNPVELLERDTDPLDGVREDRSGTERRDWELPVASR